MLQFKGDLFSKKIDLFLLFLPIWSIWLLAFVLPNTMLNAQLPLVIWVIIVLGIDVSHVWSTIFRTYLDKDEFQNHKKLLIFSPVLVFFLVYGVCYFGEYLFWRVLAYFALFHFIKQQYGFLALYQAKAQLHYKKWFNDKWTIYFSMLYPVIYWHFHTARKYDWFVENDFSLPASITDFQGLDLVFEIGNYLYWCIIMAWLIEELYFTIKIHQTILWGKILWFLTTAINWYLGIINFNSDIVFTMTNVVAHGIPYIILIYIYKHKKDINLQQKSVLGRNMALGIIIFISSIFLLGFTEEYCWDWFINRSKVDFFNNILAYPTRMLADKNHRIIVIAILSIPQITHYIIDGFIWKKNDRNPYLKFLFKE